MIVTKAQISKNRAKMQERLRNYVPETFGDRFTKIVLGLSIFAVFPIMAAFYPSAVVLANIMLGLLVLIRFAEVCVLAFGLQVMEQMPTDIRKMQRTMLGDESHLLGHVIAMTGFVWILFVCGFPVFAILLAMFASAAVVLNCKFYKLCETEAV